MLGRGLSGPVEIVVSVSETEGTVPTAVHFYNQTQPSMMCADYTTITKDVTRPFHSEALLVFFCQRAHVFFFIFVLSAMLLVVTVPSRGFRNCSVSVAVSVAAIAKFM